MGSNQSIQTLEDDEEEDEDEEEEGEEENGETIIEGDSISHTHSLKKVLEQEPEMLPCHSSASPLSPQLSSLGTPRMGPTIKVWDPYNVLGPPSPLPPPHPVSFGRSYSSDGMVVVEDGGGGSGGAGGVMEVYLISNGESEMILRCDLINGRGTQDGLTSNGKRQARALAVFLKSQGVRFNAVYTSPLDRAKDTALSVCQEMSFPELQIQSLEALTEMSHGHWEGCPYSEIYTPDIINLLHNHQPDFAPPSGESLRQVEFRMVHFLNSTLLVFPEKLRPDLISPRPNNPGFSQQNSHSYPNSISDRDGPSYPPPNWDLLYRHRQLSRKKSGKSRLQMVTTTGDNYHEEEISPKDPIHRNSTGELNSRDSSTCVGVFTHSTPIKCLLTGILGCSPIISHKICIEDSSVTVLQHSWKTGWRVKRLNDTAHLRLL